MALVYVNGALVEEQEATISVFDHGLIVGDAVFETILLSERRPFALTRHVARIARSAHGLGLVPPPGDEIVAAVQAVVSASEFSRGRIRVTVTAGRGPLGSGRLEGPPTLIVAIGAMGEEHEQSHVAVVPWPRNERGALAGLKTTSYGENALALAWAETRGADEAIFANTVGALCEGTGSNVFYVVEGEFRTPTLQSGCLAGITRALVVENDAVVERDDPAADFNPDGVLEAFLTSTLRGVQPIAAINGVALAVSPGPRTRQAAEIYNEIVRSNVDP